MAKKGNKRSLETSEGAGKAGVPSQGAPKKLKIKKEPKTNGAAANGAKSDQKKAKKGPQVQQTVPKKLQDPKAIVKNAKKEKKQVEKPDQTPEQKKDRELKVLQKKLEAKDKKKMIRKEKRQENGQYRPENIKLSADEIKIRIENMRSRGKLSRTARRKLAALQKKLRIEEGTYTPTAQLPKVEKLSESLKKKIRKHKMVIKRSETEGTEQEKTKKLEEKAKAVGKLVKQETGEQVAKIDGGKSGKKGKGKGQKGVAKVEPESDDDDDSEEEVEGESEEDSEELDSTLNTSQEVDNNDDDDEEDSEEIDSTLNTSQEVDSDDDDDDEDEEEDSEEIDSTLNTSQEVESDDDDDDDDDEEEEEEEKVELKVKTAAPKSQKVVKQTVKPEQAAKNPQQQQNSEKKTRYVLFVGNLPYAATQDDIKKHFLTKVSTIASVRIPTDNQTNKPRGFAYVEFSNSTDYEKGLSLHESTLLGRRINVQYSQPGSKSTGKRPDVVAKNQKLHAMRKQGQLAGSVKNSYKRTFRRNQNNKSRG